MREDELRFEVSVTTLYRLLFIVILCAPFWFTVAAWYAKKMLPGTTRASRTIARVLTALFWANLTYSLLVTVMSLAVMYYPRQPVLDCVLFLSTWPSVLVWWLLRLLIRFGGGRTRDRTRAAAPP